MKSAAIFFLLFAVAAASTSSSSSSSSGEPMLEGKPALRAAAKKERVVAEKRRLGKDDKEKQTHVSVEKAGKKAKKEKSGSDGKKEKKQKKENSNKAGTGGLPEGVDESRVSFRTGTSRAATRSQCSQGQKPSVNHVKNYKIGFVGASGCSSDNDCMSGCCMMAYVTGFKDCCFDVAELTDHALKACKKDTVCDQDEQPIDITGGQQ